MLKAGPVTPPVGPTVPPKPPAESVTVTELATLPGPDRQITAFRFSDKHELLVYAEPAGVGAAIVNAKTGDPLPLPKLPDGLKLRSIDLAPDQTAAFATDGQTLHRLDLATRKWESRPFVGTRVMALDATTALLQVKVTNPATWAVVKWEGAAVRETSRMEWQLLMDLGYDPTSKVLFAHYSAMRSTAGAVLERYARAGDEFRSEGSKNLSGGAPRLTLRPVTADGRYFVSGSRAMPTEAKGGKLVQFNEPVLGTVGGWAVSGSGQLFAVESGLPVGKLPQPVEAVAASADGKTVWGHSRAAKKFIQYKIEPTAK